MLPLILNRYIECCLLDVLTGPMKHPRFGLLVLYDDKGSGYKGDKLPLLIQITSNRHYDHTTTEKIMKYTKLKIDIIEIKDAEENVVTAFASLKK